MQIAEQPPILRRLGSGIQGRNRLGRPPRIRRRGWGGHWAGEEKKPPIAIENDAADAAYEPIWNVPAVWTLSDELPTYTVYTPGAVAHEFAAVFQ